MDCPSHQQTQVHASKHPVHKLLVSSFFGVWHFAKSLNSVVSCCSTEHLQVQFDIFSKIGKLPRMGENKV